MTQSVPKKSELIQLKKEEFTESPQFISKILLILNKFLKATIEAVFN